MSKRKVISATTIIFTILVISYLIIISIKKQSTIDTLNTLNISINGENITLKGEGKYNRQDSYSNYYINTYIQFLFSWI